MSVSKCDRVRELIPELAAGRLAESDAADFDAHLGGCAECRAELELAALLAESRPVAPARLVEDIEAAVRADRRSPRRPWWGLAAAAVAAVALGIGVSSEGPAASDAAVPGYAYEAAEQDLWLVDDGLVAGAPALEALSEEALAQLLDELVVGGSGGAA